MSKTLMLTFAVALVLVLSLQACGGKTPSEKASDAGQSAGQAVNDAAKATGGAVGDAANATGKAVGDATKATGDFLTQSKDTSVKTAQETLDGIEKKWQALLAKAAPTTDQAKAYLQKAKDLMAQALAVAKARLVEAAHAGAWQQDVKPALDAALQEAQQLYEDTAAKLGIK